MLKPFSFDRFIIAIDKAVEKLQWQPAAVTVPVDAKADNYFFVKADSKIFKIAYEDLLYAEASGNYTKIVTAKNTILPGMSFSSVEELLPKAQFLRVHRSYIINKSKISHIEGNRVFINATEIPVGSNYKDAFLKELGLF